MWEPARGVILSLFFSSFLLSVTGSQVMAVEPPYAPPTVTEVGRTVAPGATVTTTTYNSTDVPKTIDGSSIVNSVISLPCSRTILDVNVQLDITHTYDGDLDIYLVAPDGTRVELSTDNGFSNADYSGTIFDDEAATAITLGTAPFSGSYRPEGSLAVLDGGGSSGIWTLEITDDYAAQDDGILNSWSLTVQTSDGPTYHSSDIPKTVGMAENMVTSMIPVCRDDTITDVNVQLDISHLWDADLDIYLIAPDGTRVELSTDNGVGQNYSNTIFDDEAMSSITDGSPPFAGTYRPEGSLGVLDGKPAGGTWRLELSDDLPAINDGTLNSWSLTFTTVAAPYSFSTYVSGLPSSPAGLTIDPRSGTIYYADYGGMTGQEGVLREIAPDKMVSTVTNDFTPTFPIPGGNFYPYIHTDLQLFEGGVYVSLGAGELVRIDTKTGITTTEHTFSGFAAESGITVKGNELLVTSGYGPAMEIQSFNTRSKSATTLINASPLTSVMNVKHNPVNGKIYFSTESGGTFRFYSADADGGAYDPVPGCYLSDRADFEITPDGEYLVAVNLPDIELLSLIDGSVTTLYNGLTLMGRHDMVFAPSSVGAGCSLFVVEGTSILEISGFEGRCGSPFPWTMFMPAVIGNH